MTKYKFVISPEAANDIPNCFDDPRKKFHHASIHQQDKDMQGVPKQTIRFNFELVGYEFGKDYNHYSTIEIPIDGLIEMLKFSMRTIADGYHLTHKERDCPLGT